MQFLVRHRLIVAFAALLFAGLLFLWSSKRQEPFQIQGLHAGQIVAVNEKDVFDYIHYFPDKRREGNTTGAILEKMNNPLIGKEPAVPVKIPDCK